MGYSASAILFYGFAFEDTSEEEDAKPISEDWEDKYAATVGVKEPEKVFSDSTKEEYRAYWRAKEAAVKRSGCEIDREGGSWPFVCITASKVVANDGEAARIRVNTGETDTHRDDQLRAFCLALGIPWQEPAWYIVSYYG